MSQIKLTETKKSELEEELKDRKENIRPAILERLTFAKSLGDLSENAEYHGAREEQGKNETRIQEIEHILKNAVIIEKRKDGIIDLGSIVTLQKDTGEQKIYSIVSPEEADMANSRLAVNSPLGNQLLNKTTGESVKIQTPKGETIYKIISVS